MWFMVAKTCMLSGALMSPSKNIQTNLGKINFRILVKLQNIAVTVIPEKFETYKFGTGQSICESYLQFKPKPPVYGINF